MRTLDSKRARDVDDDRDEPRGTPGRATLTSRLPPAARVVASEVVRQLQAKGDLAGPDAHEVAAYGMVEGGGSLPFLDQIQRAFGHHDISGVRAHVGGRASEASAALGASAYAAGDAVAFASAPDLHLAAHEAAHVVQQRGGVRLAGGLGRAGDAYEVNADAVADRVVRGESAQDLLDPFSHRGTAGGAAVQREERAGTTPGVRELDRLLLRGRPAPAQVVACMRHHPDDARAILGRVRERLGDGAALEVEVAVGMTAPELVPVLGSPRARGTSPVGTAGGTRAAPGPATPAPSPVELHATGDGVTATAHPDAHSTVEATVGAGATSPVLRDVRVVIADEAPRASAALEVGADLAEGRGRAAISGELHPEGEDGPALSGEASVSAGAGDEGGVDVRGAGSLALRVPVGDHAELREAMILTEDGHLRVELGAELLRGRVRRLREDNAAREPLLRLFMTVDTDLGTGERSVSGGASLEVPLRDTGGSAHDDAGELRQLAVAGTRSGGGALPHLAQIQAAFGHHDVTGVRAHVGGEAAAATGAMGARGYAYGDDVAFASAPDLRLAAHEAAHVVQQRGGVRLAGGVGRAGDEYEQHADAVAERVVRGESAQALLDERAHRGAAGGPAVQRDEEADRAWLASLQRDAEGHYIAADGRELSAAEERRLRRILHRSGGAARSAPRSRPATVARHARVATAHTGTAFEPTELDEARDRRAGTHGTSADPESPTGSEVDARSGGRVRRMGRTHRGEPGRRADRERVRRDTIDETATRVLPGGVRVTRHEEGERALRVGPDRAAADIHDELAHRDAELAEALNDTTDATERARLTAERTRLRRDMATLAAPSVSAADAARIATSHGIGDTREEDVTTTTTSTDRNPLDGTVGDATETARDVREADGLTARDVDRRSRTLDLAGGTYTDRAEDETTATTSSGSSMTERSSTSTRVEGGGGRVTSTRTRREESSERRADGTSERTATETSTSAGAILGEHETGARVGRTSRREHAADGTRTTTERSGALEVTDRRVGGSGSAMGEVRRGSVAGTARVSSDGSFAIDVTPMTDGSGRFRLTFTIHVGAGLEGTASLGSESIEPSGALDAPTSARGRGSVTGRASARGDLITSRVISEEEAARYLAAADRADRGEEVSDPPEFGRLARLRVAGEHRDAMLQSGAVFGDGAAAAAMTDGDSITLDTEVGVGADASLGGTRDGFGASVGAGGDAHWRRTVQVERITVRGAARVRVTVSYHDDIAGHGEIAGSAPEIAARVRYGAEAGATDAVQFVLDPEAADYDARYGAIVGTTDRDALRALETRYAEDVRRSRHASTGAEELEYEGGPSSAAMVGAHERTTRTDDVTTVMDADGRPEGLEASIEGGTDTDLRARVRDRDIDVIGHAETARGTVDPTHGARVDIEAREEHIDPLAAVADGAHALGETDLRGAAALVVARTPAEHLMRALQEFSHTWGYHLDEHDLEVMGERATDAHTWSGCCIVPDRDVLAAWSNLRGALAYPRPAKAEASVDRAAAVSIARLRGLSTWMQHAHGRGVSCIERVLRRWGETTTHEVDAERLGAGYEWPVSLRATHTRYDALVTQAEGMRDRYESALSRAAGDTEAAAFHETLSTGLDAVLSEVRACSDFASAARRSEMLTEIENHRADARARYADFVRRWGALHGAGHDAVTDADIAATRASGAEITAARSREYVNAGLRVLRDNHARETHLLQEVQAIMRDAPDDALFGARARADGASLCSRVHDLHRTWIQQIQDLRQAYTQAGMAESTWQVSTGPGAPRHRPLEPNVGWLVIEYTRVMEHAPLADDWQGRVAQWRQEGDTY